MHKAMPIRHHLHVACPRDNVHQQQRSNAKEKTFICFLQPHFNSEWFVIFLHQLVSGRMDDHHPLGSAERVKLESTLRRVLREASEVVDLFSGPGSILSLSAYYYVV
jgi:hypothetical protein